MLANQGNWDDLPEQCKRCQYIRVTALNMNNKHYYSCGKYPLKNKDEECPKFQERQT